MGCHGTQEKAASERIRSTLHQGSGQNGAGNHEVTSLKGGATEDKEKLLSEQIGNGWVSQGIPDRTWAPGITPCFTDAHAPPEWSLGLSLLADGNTDGLEALTFQYRVHFFWWEAKNSRPVEPAAGGRHREMYAQLRRTQPV